MSVLCNLDIGLCGEKGREEVTRGNLGNIVASIICHRRKVYLTIRDALSVISSEKEKFPSRPDLTILVLKLS